jgi:hypothetical protein
MHSEEEGLARGLLPGRVDGFAVEGGPQDRVLLGLPAQGQQQGAVALLEGLAGPVFPCDPALCMGVGGQVRLAGQRPRTMAASEAVTPWARQRSHSGERWVRSTIFMIGDSSR